MNLLTLKGGNALRILGESSRFSQDIDFSLADQGELATRDRMEIQQTIFKAFLAKGFQVLNYSFLEKPKYPDNNPGNNLLGGYTITFSIIEQSSYARIPEQNQKIASRRAYPLENQQKKIKIDISKDEYVRDRETIQYQNYLIHIYSPLMVVYEKVRASCQQLPEYKRPKIRARDLYDIYNLLTSRNQNL
ncbi:nucleotidyl transferase AbiEii/AbiGii toxin family protein [Oenococcus sicerae]|uniref:Nucleotidyl transferase AbiEii/AbiGii toxin family protein n=1 Tax=Oenococcus sicerae TaxID=2203724 RepID=A0AAJ1RAB9_9LACO|nr:nucleotidyl transferase AbiEii/AbiGii toxin family protein [Oenococcus sicerae]MDN6900676.1 hypothetical protein [Oenococcus sicerae]